MRKNLKHPFALLTAWLLAVWLPAGFLFSQTGQDHDQIVEEVSVSWWQVPVFALDSAGNPVTDLEPGDIEIIVNGGIMPRFTLEKRPFVVTEMKEKLLEPGQDIPSAEQAPGMKARVIFLLFDLTLSRDSAIIHAKQVAEKIIMETEAGVHFFILTIEPFKGLAYIADGKDNRDELAWLVHEKVKRFNNPRATSAGDFMGSPLGGKRGAKYEDEEIAFFADAAGAYDKRRTMNFFYSFDTLQICLNAIEGKKFIYFFSEGISNAVMSNTRGGQSMYQYYLRRVAEYLGRSGAVLFIINTMGIYDSSFSGASGENSLSYLAKMSGGKYLEGSQMKIVQTLDNMHRAYYEVAFPDIPVRKDIPRDISINSKHSGVSIHTLSRLEKSKSYSEMSEVEKELTALNVITRNPLFKSSISILNVPITDSRQTGKKLVYTVTIPRNWVNNSLDLYKVGIWKDKTNPASSRVKQIDKESLLPKKDTVEIDFKVKRLEKAAEQEGGELNYYFVLVNARANQLYVHGIENTPDR